MREALWLAERGRGHTKLNPLVGALVVKDGVIRSRGYHAFFGGPHAEIVALKRAGRAANGATLYVTLEPCSTQGKTPPCTEAIIQSGIKKVVIGSFDPNPQHHKRGVRILRKNNIAVSVGLLKNEIKKQNEAFFTRMSKKRPFVTVKMAQSLDGKSATRTGDSQWISGITSRTGVHQLRKNVDAVLVGKQTVLYDDPSLTVRFVSSTKNPARVILDTQGEIPLTKKVFHYATRDQVIIVVSKKVSSRKIALYQKKGISVIQAPLYRQKIDVAFVLKRLVDFHIGTVLVEGGGNVAASFFERKLVDKMFLFCAPLIIGGMHAPTSVEGNGVACIKKAIRFRNVSYSKSGNDYLFEGYPIY
ncbi:MAG: bifunctional diaminohydroxyphosphoribosylaminopyrimidine deaminase/5-amino-6-(5-phosphoribosylamino)uracil reductase RibD [Candidatus Omnitrophica bacterium]|nr:bifunctional diaminohydroxyphosphoribosylaminopyrimidine deaminase/5-amino-6-(5-phosphoribosylamino)uracil reductase RibD [Candidatus Omnitrophota bacterium]